MALGPRLMRTGSQSVWGCVKEGYEGQFPFLPKVWGGGVNGEEGLLHCVAPLIVLPSPMKGKGFKRIPCRD